MKKKFDAILKEAKDAPAGEDIIEVCLELMELLIEKNISYGNSALEPVRIFSNANPEEQILVRLDDKLNRILKGSEFVGDDTLKDLFGYIALLLVLRSKNADV